MLMRNFRISFLIFATADSFGVFRHRHFGPHTVTRPNLSEFASFTTVAPHSQRHSNNGTRTPLGYSRNPHGFTTVNLSKTRPLKSSVRCRRDRILSLVSTPISRNHFMVVVLLTPSFLPSVVQFSTPARNCTMSAGVSGLTPSLRLVICQPRWRYRSARLTHASGVHGRIFMQALIFRHQVVAVVGQSTEPNQPFRLLAHRLPLAFGV